MAKRKQSPALFELINKNQQQDNDTGKLALPKWWKNESAQPAEAEKKTASPQPAPPRKEQPKATSPVSSPSAGTNGTGESGPSGSKFSPWGQPADGDGPSLRVQAGKVTISLNALTLAVVAVVLILAIIITFQLGRSTGPDEGDTVVENNDVPIEENIDNPDRSVNGVLNLNEPNASVLNVDGQPSAAKAKPMAGMTPDVAPDNNNPPPSAPAQKANGRIVGHNYVWVETYHKDHRKQAEHAQQWLASKGVFTTLERLKESGRWVLITEKGFEDRDKADAYAQYIQGLGKQYVDKYGPVKVQYHIKEPYVRKERKE